MVIQFIKLYGRWTYDLLSTASSTDDSWGFFLKRFGCFFLVEPIRLSLGTSVCVTSIAVSLPAGGGAGGPAGAAVNAEMHE